MEANKTLILGVLSLLIGITGIFYLNSAYSGSASGYTMPMMGYGDHCGDIGTGMMGSSTTKTEYSSNGERIYYSATSNSGNAITADMGMGPMSSSMMACVNCHGEDGKGGTIQMMMGTYEVPDIRYSALTEEGHGVEEHPPYNEELIKKAITEGIEPDGESLEFPMPKWSMSDKDLDDLVDYLKTL